MKEEEIVKKIELYGAIRLLVFGYVFEDGDIEEAMDILEDVKDLIIKEFNKQKNEQ